MSGKKKNNNLPLRISAMGIISSAFGAVALGICALGALYTEYPPEKIALLCLAIYLGFFTCFIVGRIIYSAVMRRRLSNFIPSVTHELSAQFMQNASRPLVICDKKGHVIWYNSYLRNICAKISVIYNKPLENICTRSLDTVMKSSEAGGIDVHLFKNSDREESESIYRAISDELSRAGKTYYAVVFTDVTQQRVLEQRIMDEETIIAYAMIDNLDELLQYIQEGYGSATEAVEKILERSMEGVSGFVREYGNNRFICVLEAQQLKKLEDDKFSILDEIREIRLGETALSVTISMGISKAGGSLYERERAAQSALDMALQRGGDQVVVKHKDGVDFYGGKTKAVQKRTKVRSRIIANELLAVVAKSDNVIVMGHRFPDADCFAASVAMSRIARFCGTKAHIVIDRNDKNLKHCFRSLEECSEYNGMIVDRAQAQDLMSVNTLVVVADVNNLNICEAPEIVENARDIVIIDHHRKTSEFRKKPCISYIEPSASSTSELMAELLELILPQGSLMKEEADLLFAGMLLDTKQFTHNAGVRTFGAAMYLRNEGASPLDAQALFKMNLEDFMIEAQFESNVAIYRDTIAIARNDEDTDNDLTRVNAAKAADRLLSLEGINTAFALCSVNGVICISARSDGGINVQLIAEKLGGGGHFDSAGAQLHGMDMKEAVDLLRKTLDEFLDAPKDEE